MSNVEAIKSVNSKDRLIEFIRVNLGYKCLPTHYMPEQLYIPPKASEPIKSIHLLSDYDRAFQVYLFETTSLTRTGIRSVLEPFYRRHPMGDYLFIFTKDYTQLYFVSPLRIVRPEKPMPALQLRILPLEPANVYHTDLEVLQGLALTSAEQEPETIRKKHEAALSVERVTDEFFKNYKLILEQIKGQLSTQHNGNTDQVHAFAQRFLNRLMFLYFLQKKGWLKWGNGSPDKRYMRSLWQKYRTDSKKVGFYQSWLSSLFFHAFNKRTSMLPAELPGDVRASFLNMPFLNGGLFTEDDLDKLGFYVPDDIFGKLFDRNIDGTVPGFLERCNFTIEESQPLDVEVAVDPEMLGKVYESLINEEDRRQGGIFYTPRIEIDYMCRLSLIEYLQDVTELSRDILIPIVMETARESGQKELNKLDDNCLNKLRNTLDSVRVADPAVGSGSFLVGMMNVMVQLYRAIAGQQRQHENEFALKKQIISKNLYGVDVKDWAVRVCELRLWLSLIIESEESQMDIYNSPLLPNLTFKARQGDSLVEDIAEVHLSLRADYAHIPQSVKQRIHTIVDKKADYFRGDRSVNRHDIERLEHELLQTVLDTRIKAIDSELRKLESPQKQAFQTGLEQIRGSFIDTQEIVKGLEEARARIQPQIDALNQERQRLHTAAANLSKKGEKDYFLWDIDFAEVFLEKGGFDIVIGNPPYVRQEEIAPPLLKAEDYGADEWREMKRGYKEKLENAVKAHWGKAVTKIDKKSDLYVYFYYQGLNLLRPGGLFCFINSNSWLDANYGELLQQFLLKNIQVCQVIDNHARRSFKESDVNTVIVLLRRPKDSGWQTLKDSIAKFIAYNVPFEAGVNAENLLLQEWVDSVQRVPEFRVFPIRQEELWMDGLELSEEEETQSLDMGAEYGKYSGGKWGGKYLRAPDIFYKVLEQTRDCTLPLGRFVKGQRYLNTGGANGFFILTKFSKTTDGLYYIVTNDSKEGHEDGCPEFLIEQEFLHPAIKSSDIETPLVTHTDALVLSVPPNHSNLTGTKVWQYIKWGESKGFNNRSVTRLQNPWWKAPIQARESGPLLWLRYHHRVHRAYYNPQRFIGADAFYRLYPVSDNMTLSLAGILNSTYMALWKEIFGATNYGLGVLGTRMDSMLKVPIPVLKDAGFRQKLERGFELLSIRRIYPIEQERNQSDRRALDDLIFDYLGLNSSEHEAVYDAVQDLVEKRLVKASSS